MSATLTCYWDGACLRPQDMAAAVGVFPRPGRYRVRTIEERSERSHRHYFAAIHTGWRNLPEQIAARYPSSEHLRKMALIKCGYATRREIVCAGAEEARRLIAIIEALDEYALVSVMTSVVTIWTAASQSVRSMGKAPFEKSKGDVLEYIAGLIGITVEQLADDGRRGET